MIRSIWRYSHLMLAVSSSVFLLLASITGMILAVEPISNATKDYSINDLDKIAVSKTISGLQTKYSEVLELEITPSNYVIASVLTEDFESKNVYIEPSSLMEYGEVKERLPFFNFITTLHRSLFFKGTGRIFVGLVSLFLSLIAITGILLLIKRQGGMLRFFDRVKEKNFEQRYHVILGRWLLIPIIIIAVTGVYLSAEKFNMLPIYSLNHNWESTGMETSEKLPIAEFSALKDLNLDEVRKISFPFSGDPEDFYRMQLKDRELLVHQFSGMIVSEREYPIGKLASMLSMKLHTGESNPVWAFVLLVSSASILFFMVSGFTMTIKSLKKKKLKRKPGKTDKDEAEFIVLVGSETGNTYDFANRFCENLESHKKLVHLAKLNQYTTYKNARKLVIFTATYGDGDAPASASNFLKKLQQLRPINQMEYTVVGFGSMLYPNFCSYAEEVVKKLKDLSDFQPLMELTKINEQSFKQFRGWANNWGAKEDLPIHLEHSEASEKKEMVSAFQVSEITEQNQDETFLLKLKPSRKIRFQSGDLIGITPPKARRERLYSIAKIDGNILLSIKKHELGKCSTYLSNLQVGAFLKGRIEKNQKFHFPKKAAKVIMICNGTGIAPFLGMISKSHQTDIHLFWGGRTAKSLELYKPLIETALKNNNIESLKTGFSREHPKKYVQDLLLEQTEFLTEAIKSGAILMICGSITMQNGVLEAIEDMLEKSSKLKLSDLELNEQLRLDCY